MRTPTPDERALDPRCKAFRAAHLKGQANYAAFAGTKLIEAHRGQPCPYCRTPMWDGDATPTRDHLRPRSKGGKLSFKNRVIVCRKCNVDKDARTIDEFHQWLAARGDDRARCVASFIAARRGGGSPS